MRARPVPRIVVPLDGSTFAEAVFPEVRRLLRRLDAEILLVRAELPYFAGEPVPGVPPEEDVDDARSYLERVAEKLDREGLRARTIAETGSAVDVILKAVRDRQATMIALSTHGRTGAARAVVGSVAEELLRRSPVPVLAVRTLLADGSSPVPADERQPFKNVLLPLDRSERSLRALAPAADLCRLWGARLMLLHVLEGDEDPETADAFFRAVETRAESQGVAVTTLLETGAVVEEILDVARFHDADLIAMATHGRRGLARLALGSVTEGVLRRSFVPVLVIRTQDAALGEGRESVA